MDKGCPDDMGIERKFRKSIILYILISLVAFFFYPIMAWLSVASLGHWLIFSAGLIFHIFAIVYVLICFPVISVLSLFNAYRRVSIHFVLMTIIIIIAPTAGCNVSKGWQRSIRKPDMIAYIKSMQPLVGALHQYQVANGAPPKTLDLLVPEYLPEIPSAEKQGYRNLRYLTHTSDHGSFYLDTNNAWALSVHPPFGGFDIHMMYYLPNHDYPLNGMSDSVIEPVGDWAYAHD